MSAEHTPDKLKGLPNTARILIARPFSYLGTKNVPRHSIAPLVQILCNQKTVGAAYYGSTAPPLGKTRLLFGFC